MKNNNINNIKRNNESLSGNFSFQDEVATNIKPPKLQSETANKPSIILPKKTNKKD